MEGIIRKVKGTYGFILIPNDRQIFYPISAWLNLEEPCVGDHVIFDVIQSVKPKYQEQAANVRKIGGISPDAENILAGQDAEVKS